MMYNPQLDTFICVVEAGSFSKAADKLYISPPAVIKQINSLENNLGVQLFARTHRGLVVTAAGESLYQDAKYMVNYRQNDQNTGKDQKRNGGSHRRYGHESRYEGSDDASHGIKCP
jgi:DNA-binding transcriptional LysR family regulator